MEIVLNIIGVIIGLVLAVMHEKHFGTDRSWVLEDTKTKLKKLFKTK